MLQKATEVQPQSVPCWHAWAKLELTAGNADKARELYLKALKLNPKETFTYSKPGLLPAVASACLQQVWCDVPHPLTSSQSQPGSAAYDLSTLSSC